MPKFFGNIGRLVREHTSVVVEAPNQEVIEQNMKSLFCEVEMTSPTWESDDDWGCEMSDSNDVSELDDNEYPEFVMNQDGEVSLHPGMISKDGEADGDRE